MALRISPRNELDSMLVGTKCSQTLDISKKLKTNTVASCSYKIYDSSDNEVTDTFGGGSSILSNIITFGIKAISAGTYTLQFIITCNEVLPNGNTPREFYITMTMQIIDTILVEEESAFIFDVQTTGASETFSLPLEAVVGVYDFTVDWGDNSSDDITIWNQAEVTHTYASAGTHEIKITGTIIGWEFNDGGDCTKIYEIKSWGPLKVGTGVGPFYGCSNLTISATDILDLSETSDMESFFDGCSSLTTVLFIGSWNISSILGMSYMFYGVTLSTANYDALLIGWEAQAVQNNVSFHGGNSKYSAGAATTARQALIDEHAWQITDAGQV
jgi:hypothetical protein